MENDIALQPAANEDQAAMAFERMTARLALLEAAISGLAAERNAIHIPDYTETLGELAADLADFGEAVTSMQDSPALKLTPGQFAQSIAQAGKEAREADRREIAQAKAAMDGWVSRIAKAYASAREAGEQRRHLCRVAGASLAAGMVIWAVIPGPILRALPESWHLPEHVAARMLGTDMWQGGERLLAAANPDGWDNVLIGNHIMRDNRATIEACRKAANHSGKKMRCTVVIAPENSPK